jgi:hypothetical protein
MKTTSILLFCFLACTAVNAQSFDDYYKGGKTEYYKKYHNEYVLNIFIPKKLEYFDNDESFTAIAYAMIEPIKSDTISFSISGFIRGTRYSTDSSRGMIKLIRDYMEFLKPNLVACKGGDKLPILIPFIFSKENGILCDSVVNKYNYFYWNRESEDINTNPRARMPILDSKTYFIFEPVGMQISAGSIN